MTDVLTQNETTRELVEAWEKEAETIERWQPESEIASTIRRCATSLRRVVDETAPDEVPLSAVKDRTGWGDSWLLQKMRELDAQGAARKRNGVWWIDRYAALGIPKKRGYRPTVENTMDLNELAERILDLQTT